MTEFGNMRRLNMPSERLILSGWANLRNNVLAWFGQALLFLVTSVAAAAVLFIIYYIARDAIPFFRIEGFREFFTSANWYPSGDPPSFGVLSIMLGSVLVTVGAAVVAIPLGVSAAICLSDILPFSMRQSVKPVIEILAAIPSVAYGFFALVILAPMLQQNGGRILAVGWYLIALPFLFITVAVLSDLMTAQFMQESRYTG